MRWTRNRVARAALAAAFVAATAPLASAQSGTTPRDLARMVEALKATDPEVRAAAAVALGRLGPAAAPAAEPLVAAFTDADSYVRGAAAVALGQIGQAAVPTLVRALADPNPETRWSAGIALGRIGRAGAAAIPALMTAASDANDNVRYVAVVALGELGRAASEATPLLTEALHDPDDSVRAAARRAMQQVAPGSRRLDLVSVAAAVDRLAPALMAELNVPGASVAIVHDRQVAWTAAYGVASASTKAPVIKETAFEAASMSKPIFGLLVMQLVEQQRLDLDRPLADYAEELFVPDQPERRLVTARMVLSHTSGYPNWRPGGEEREGPLPLLFTPGSRYGYSGEGIFYLQRVVERITGERLDRLAEDRLFRPLGLQHTAYAWTPAIEATQSTGHDDKGAVRTKSKYTHPNAAYSLYTTAGDYARLLVEVMKAERGTSPHVSQASVREMLKHQVALESGDPIERPDNTGAERVFRGLGWAINTTAQGDVLHHSGANGTGFRCFSQFSPVRGMGLVILTNGANGGELWTRLVAAVGDF